MSSLPDHSRVKERRRDLAPVAQPRTRLTVVHRRQRRAPRVPFVFAIVLMLAAGVVGLLVLNTSLQQGAFSSAALQAKANDLLNRQQQLELKVEALRNPQRVATRAERLGMVPNPNPVFLRLVDGAVLGRPQSAPSSTSLPLRTDRTPLHSWQGR